MALKEPLGTLLVVAIWTVCPCMTPESLAHLLHRLLHSGTRVFLRPTVRHASHEIVLAQSARTGGPSRRYGFEEE